MRYSKREKTGKEKYFFGLDKDAIERLKKFYFTVIFVCGEEDINFMLNKDFVLSIIDGLKISGSRWLINIRLAKKELIISNTGKAEELPPEKLFNRFSKSNESVQSNGLGLAIVKKIADLNNWSIIYSFSENKHTFSVQFK